MASITIRQLDEDLKQRLRLRAARNGRSMEDEARTILRSASAGEDMRTDPRAPNASPRKPAPQRPPSADERRTDTGKRVLLIIGGGIAAYKPLDLVRRLKGRGIAVRFLLTTPPRQFTPAP